MAIGNLIHAEDLQLPEGAKLDIANNPTIITMAGRGVDQADGSEETTG
jgi:hypothetical protein